MGHDPALYERVKAQILPLDELLDDTPPLLTMVVLADGSALCVAHAQLKEVSVSWQHSQAALNLIRAFLRNLDRDLERMLDDMQA